MRKDKLISLKEAAQISGYSADYIGQLIRAGKIDGMQVYCNVAWMTTTDAVLNYKKQNEDKGRKAKNGGVSDYLASRKRKMMMEINILKIFFTTFKTALPIFLALLAIVIAVNLVFVYFFASSYDLNIKTNSQNKILTY